MSILDISEEKKTEYWNYFLKLKSFHANGFTSKRLEKIKPFMWQWSFFWEDIILRHGAIDKSPEQLKVYDKIIYEHCMGNMAGMIYEQMCSHKLL